MHRDGDAASEIRLHHNVLVSRPATIGESAQRPRTGPGPLWATTEALYEPLKCVVNHAEKIPNTGMTTNICLSCSGGNPGPKTLLFACCSNANSSTTTITRIEPRAEYCYA